MIESFNQLVLVGIPFDDNSSFEKGPALAPAIIRNVLANGSLNKGTELGVSLANNSCWQVGSDISINRSDDVNQVIAAEIDTYLANKQLTLSLGGDHSISYPIVKSYAEHFGKVNIVHIDAHSDLYDSFKGNRYSNACPFARIMEAKLCGRLVQFGIRTLNEHQVAQAEKFGVEMHEMKHWPPTEPLEQLLTFDGPVYISLDIDSLDPAFAPGVSHREPGGLSTREVIQIIHAINAPVIGADLVEMNPNKDIDGLTAQVAAKLVKEISGKMLQNSH